MDDSTFNYLLQGPPTGEEALAGKIGKQLVKREQGLKVYALGILGFPFSSLTGLDKDPTSLLFLLLLLLFFSLFIIDAFECL